MAIILNSFGLMSALMIIVGLVIYSKKLQPAWSARGFNEIDGQWDWTFALSSYVALLTFFYLYTHRNDTVASAFMGNGEPIPFMVIIPMVIVAFVFTLSAWTDALIFKAPMEIAHIAMVLGAIFMFGDAISTNDWTGVISAAIWMIVPTVLYVQLGFGAADSRLLCVVAFCVAWWAGWYMTFLIFGIGCVIQLVLALTYKWTKWGEVIQLKPSKSTITYRRMLKKFRPNADIKLTRTKEPRVVTPLIPALAVAYIFVLSYLLATGNTTLLINGGVGILGT